MSIYTLSVHFPRPLVLTKSFVVAVSSFPRSLVVSFSPARPAETVAISAWFLPARRPVGTGAQLLLIHCKVMEADYELQLSNQASLKHLWKKCALNYNYYNKLQNKSATENHFGFHNKTCMALLRNEHNKW